MIYYLSLLINYVDCLNHEKNENAYPYSFSSDQLNTLKGMISGNQLS